MTAELGPQGQVECCCVTPTICWQERFVEATWLPWGKNQVWHHGGPLGFPQNKLLFCSNRFNIKESPNITIVRETNQHARLHIKLQQFSWFCCPPKFSHHCLHHFPYCIKYVMGENSDCECVKRRMNDWGTKGGVICGKEVDIFPSFLQCSSPFLISELPMILEVKIRWNLLVHPSFPPSLPSSVTAK